MKKTKQQSWKGFIQGLQLCASLGACYAPPVQGGFAGRRDVSGRLVVLLLGDSPAAPRQQLCWWQDAPQS